KHHSAPEARRSRSSGNPPQAAAIPRTGQGGADVPETNLCESKYKENLIRSEQCKAAGAEAVLPYGERPENAAMRSL
ncbi:MAG: hypothetical protein M0P13_07840, partial [Fibrobacteraceae bacterium]|nr:hypothetical protein [Fibrobacteraceae bacterium]